MKAFFTLIFTITATLVSAQVGAKYSIKGRTVNATTESPVAYATLILRDTVNVLKALTSDDKGNFKIEISNAGNYTLEVKFVGFEPFNKEITLASDKIVDLGDIAMKEGVEIDEVVVMGQLVTLDIDKTTYNTSMDPEATSQTAMEMMRKVPMLSVTGEDNLELKGQSNFKILVNGKASTMMNRNYKDVLRSMPASSIKSIEVITNPPAKYDAEGVGGIINIITVRKTNNSYNGRLMTMGDSMGAFMGGGYFASSMGKFSMSLNGFIGRVNIPEITTTERRENFSNTNSRFVKSDGTTKMDYLIRVLAFEAGYEIDSLNLLSLSFNTNGGNRSLYGNSITEYLNATNITNIKYGNASHMKGNFGNLSANIDYQKSFMKPDRMLTLSYMIEHNPDGSSYENKIENIVDYRSYVQAGENDAWGMEHTLQLDFVEPIKANGMLEVGGKYILRPNHSSSDYYIDGTLEPTRDNGLDYVQHVSALYTSYQHRIKKFTLKGGLRAEYTINTGTFKLQNNHEMFNRFFDLLPYATISYSVNQGQNIRLAYNQRISRPSIYQLNPYVNEENPESIQTGNPNLKSSVSHSFDLNYGKYSQKGNFNISIATTQSNNIIQRFTTVRPDGKQFTTYENVGREQAYGMYFNGALNLRQGKMRLNINSGLSYIVQENRDNNMKNSGWTGNISGGFYSALWKNANLNAYGGYYSPNRSIQSKSYGGYYHGFNVSQSLFDRKISVNLGVQNPFTNNRIEGGESWGEDFRSITETTYRMRSVRIGVAWMFGKTMTQVRKARRSISNDDKMQGESKTPGMGQ